MLRKISNICLVVQRNVSTKFGVLGVPLDKGQPKVGVADGPKAIRCKNLIKEIKSIHESVDLADYGDVSYSSNLPKVEVENMKQYTDVIGFNHEISKMVEKILKDDRICLSLGGDHSMGLGTVDGHIKAKNGNVCVLWVDAHADINTSKTSPSGNIHGMPVALLAKELKEFWPDLPQKEWQQPALSLKNIAYIGLRAVDDYERLFIEKYGIAAYAMDDIVQHGIHQIVNTALNKIDPEKNRSIHLSFDIDALDILVAPSTGTACPGGLNLREGIHLVEQIYDTGRLGAMDLVEVNPALGSEENVRSTVDAAIHLLKAACGYKRRGPVVDGKTVPK